MLTRFNCLILLADEFFTPSVYLYTDAPKSRLVVLLLTDTVLPHSSNWYVDVRSSEVPETPSAPYVFIIVVLYFVLSKVIF